MIVFCIVLFVLATLYSPRHFFAATAAQPHTRNIDVDRLFSVAFVRPSPLGQRLVLCSSVLYAYEYCAVCACECVAVLYKQAQQYVRHHMPERRKL